MEKKRGFELVCNKLKRFQNWVKVKLPLRASKHSAGWDFFLLEDLTIKPGETKITWTDVKAYMQPDEVLLIHIRSSWGIKKNLSIANGTGIIDCVPKGTLIATPDGNKKIEEIFNSSSKEIIYSYNEELNEIEKDIISDIWIVNDLHLLEIESEEGDIIKIPLNKEVYTERGWIKARDLCMNDKILKI